MTFAPPRLALYWCVIVPFFSFWFCFHERAYAQEPNSSACVSAHSLVFKAKAPCTGILVPEVDALKALKCVSEKLPKCLVDKKASEDKAEAREKALRAEVAAEKKQSAALRRLLDEATRVAPPEHPWWKHPVLWTVVGITLGAASAYAIVKLSEK